MPQIDAAAAVVYRTADRSTRSEWFVAPLFIARTAVPADGDETAADLHSGRSSSASTITDLSALAPPSDCLSVRRSEKQEARP